MDKATDLYCINEDPFLKALEVLYRRSRNMLQTKKVRAIGACLEEPRLPSPSCPAQRCKIGSRGPVGPSPSMPQNTIASQGFRTTPRLPGKVNRQPSLLLHVSSRCCKELKNLCNTCVFSIKGDSKCSLLRILMSHFNLLLAPPLLVGPNDPIRGPELAEELDPRTGGTTGE